MRFAFLAATLLCGMTTVTAQSLNPAPLVKSSPTTRGLTASNLPGQRNTGSQNQNVVIGGSDDCSTPDAINGLGTFTFNQVGATTGTEGQNESICYAFASSVVDSDVWFAWTAPTTDTFLFETCGMSSTDTKIGVYPGSTCPTTGSALACNDDYCGLQSQVTFSGTAAAVYMLQVGTYPGAVAGTGSISLTVFVPLSNDDCSSPTAISGAGSFPFDLTTATTGIEGQAELICTFNGGTPIDFDVWFAWTSDFTGTARLSTCTGNAIDSKVAVYPGSSCPTFGTSLACNDDVQCPPCSFYPWTSQIDWSVVDGSTYMIQLGTFPASSTAGSGTFTVEEYVCNPACEICNPGVMYCAGDGTGTSCPCSNDSTNGGGCANGAGNGGILDAEGTASILGDTLVLKSTDLLPNQPCLFFQGLNAVNSGMGITFGDGLRCSGGGVVRLQVRFPNSSGEAETTLIISVKGGCTAGDLRRYQNWYRDPVLTPCGTGFNLTNGYEITWAI